MRAQFAEALRERLEHAIAHYQPGQKLSNVQGVDDLVATLAYCAPSLWHLGYPDRALEMNARALERANGSD